jgi:4,5-dihydroxyphthalate decarboxylase
MADTTTALSVAVWRYDRTQALYDGRVKVEGYTARFIDAPLEDIFSRAFDRGEFDASELSFSNNLRLTVAGTCPYAGIPIFPSRSFRHSAFYVRTDDSIRTPEDLVGRKVGVREFSMTAALAARGALRDGFGIDTNRIEWIVGDVDEVERSAIPLPALYKDLKIEALPVGHLLSSMLLAGEIDAILAYKPITPFKKGDQRVRRLFDDHEAAEKEYFARTRVFPIMHLMGLRQDRAAGDPGLARALYDAFAEAQRLAMEDLHLEQALKIALPWLASEVKRTAAVMGEDFWPNGLAANRAVLERMIAWSFADGLIPRAPAPEELFVPSLRDT